jgi:hypothetical protein
MLWVDVQDGRTQSTAVIPAFVTEYLLLLKVEYFNLSKQNTFSSCFKLSFVSMAYFISS